jgi:hypothetical protein
LRDALRRSALLLDRGGNRRGDLADEFDRKRDYLDRTDGLFRGALHVDNVRADLVGGLCSLARQGFDLLGDHRKSAAGLAGPGGLDGRVEREQVGLFRNRRDQLHHIANPVACGRQFRHPLIRGAGLLDRIGGNTVRLLNTAADFDDRLGQFVRGRRGAADMLGGLPGGTGGLSRHLRRRMGGRGKLSRILFELPRRVQYPLDDATDLGAEILDKLI